MKGMLMLLGKPKGKGEESEEGDESDPRRAYAKEAYAALKDDDEEGFVEALLGLHSCGEPDEDDAEPEE